MEVSNGVPFTEMSFIVQTLSVVSPLLWIYAWHLGRPKKGQDNSRTARCPQLFHQLTNGRVGQVFGPLAKYLVLVARLTILGVLLWTWQTTLKAGSKLPFPLFSFFTIWNFVLLTVYFAVVSLLSTAQCFFPHFFRQYIQYVSYPTWLLYQQQLTANVVVSIGFWVFTYPTLHGKINTKYLTSSQSFVQHLFNSIFIIMEFLWIQLPVEWRRFDIVTMASVVYLTVSVLSYGTLPSIPIDLKNHASALVVITMLLIHIGAHAAFCRLSPSVKSLQRSTSKSA